MAGFSSKWQDPRIEDGVLVLEPTSSGWFEDMQAGHLYQPIEVDLRIARQGELFSLLYRVDQTEEFTLLDQFIRPDLPETLNVGLTAYADWGSVASLYPDFQRYNQETPPLNGDLIARVQRIDFRRPSVDRFPVATLDPAVSFMPEIAQQRYEDLSRN